MTCYAIYEPRNEQFWAALFGWGYTPFPIDKRETAEHFLRKMRGAHFRRFPDLRVVRVWFRDENAPVEALSTWLDSGNRATGRGELWELC